MRFSLLLFFLFCFLSSFAQDAESLYKEGIAFHDKGEYRNAVNKYKQALVLLPNSGTLYYELAFSYHALKLYDSAIINADKAIAIGGDETKRMAMTVKGSVLDDRGDTKESIRFYEKALKEYPTDYLLLFNYGISCRRANREDDAEKAFIAALTSKLTHPGSNLHLSNLKRDAGEKMKPMLGLYFFLLLENNTSRAEGAYNILKGMTMLEEKGKNQQINLFLPSGSKKGSEQAMAAELTVSLLGMTINELDKKMHGDTLSSYEKRFVTFTEKFFDLANEVTTNKASKKEKENDFWATTYIPFFTQLKSAGHTEAFCYHIMMAGESKIAEAWLNDNKEKRELFYLWLRNH